MSPRAKRAIERSEQSRENVRRERERDQESEREKAEEGIGTVVISCGEAEVGVQREGEERVEERSKNKV